ncbi:VanW family protein [Pseudalkalibacillus caeni]|uniref:VanW family protein n=1 Tax=Exobacillus caeni TaxID=2574798 RepID=UPI001485B098|nr:VanW family protein [Pseudalkalibacillus caeni]
MSQFHTSMLKNFTVIIACTSFILGLTFSGATGYIYVFGEEKIAENTTVGPVNVGNLTYEEARERLAEEVSAWKATNQVTLVYLEKKIALSPNLWVFDFEQSLQLSNGRSSSPFIVTVDEEELARLIKEELQYTEALDIKGLSIELIEAAAGLVSEKRDVSIMPYVSGTEESSLVAEGKLNGFTTAVLLPELAETLNGNVIDPKETFSLLTFLKENQYEGKDSQSLSLLASGLYQAVLQTNFDIIERHAPEREVDFGEMGMNAALVPDQQDLVFHNPNYTAYTIKAEATSNSLSIKIMGYPLAYTYDIKTEKKELMPRTTIRYSSDLMPDQKVVVDEGEKGYSVTTYRLLYDSVKDLIDKRIVSEDYISPAPRIERRGYPIDATEVPSEMEGTSNTDSGNENDNLSDENSGTYETEEITDTETDYEPNNNSDNNDDPILDDNGEPIKGMEDMLPDETDS